MVDSKKSVERQHYIVIHKRRKDNTSSSGYQTPILLLVTDKPKLAHSILIGKMKDRMDPTVLRQQGTDKILFKAAEKRHISTLRFSTRCHDPSLTGRLLRLQGNVPWDQPYALDKFGI